MRILYILVLYQQKLETSITYQSLMHYLNEEASYQLLVYDNSPFPQEITPKKQVIYHHDSSNGGIQAAYQYGYEFAQKKDIPWLCFLDQDTQLSSDYLKQLQEATIRYQQKEDIASLVPFVQSQNQMISPTFTDSVRPLRQKATPEVGINSLPITAIASGTIIKTAFVELIGGFHSPFSLDYFDHWLFWKMTQLKKKSYVLDAVIEHDLSVLHYQDMSLERYRSILFAENRFYQHFAVSLQHKFHRQLFFRSIKQFLTVKNKKIAQTTFQLWLRNWRKH